MSMLNYQHTCQQNMLECKPVLDRRTHTHDSYYPQTYNITLDNPSRIFEYYNLHSMKELRDKFAGIDELDHKQNMNLCI